MSSAQVDVTLRALDAYEVERAEARRNRQLQGERVEHEVEIASGRYEETDPANRLAAPEVGVEPPLDGARGDPQVGGDVLVLPAPVGQLILGRSQACNKSRPQGVHGLGLKIADPSTIWSVRQDR